MASLVTGAISLVGALVLIFRSRLSAGALRLWVSFAAGAMLSAALLDLLPEALAVGEVERVTALVLGGIVLFFIAEKFLLWHHHSHAHAELGVKPAAPLILVGDTLHNFLDGTVIALTFSVDVTLGMVATVAIIGHEIPQEIGDFAVLLDAGFSRARALFWNAISSLSTLVGALLTFWLGGLALGERPEPLALAAGMFMYIATADLLPQIHHESNRRLMVWQSVALLAGILLIAVVVRLFE